LYHALKRPGRDLVQGAQGVAEGLPASATDKMIDKFQPDGLLIVRAGGEAGYSRPSSAAGRANPCAMNARPSPRDSLGEISP